MIIYIARHGQTTGDIEHRYGGDYDDHLTELGEQQSSKLAKNLTNKGIEQIFASPLARAQETADFVAKELGLQVATIEGFKEQNRYGVLTGVTKDEAKEKYPEEVEKLKDVHAQVQDAEAFTDFQQRIDSALEQASTASFGKIAIVAHGGPIRHIFRELLASGEVDVDDCAYFSIEANEGTYKLIDSEGIAIK